MEKFAADKVHKEIEMSNMGHKAIKIVKDKNGDDLVLLQNRKGYSVQVKLHGGQVLSWTTNRGEELLFMSEKVTPTGARGGISICFPEVENGSKQHGFVSDRMWVIEDNPTPLHSNDSSGKICIDLLLKSSAGDLIVWPHEFEFRLRVALALNGSLSLTSHIKNLGRKPLSFSFAHHAYFSVSDIGEVRVEGLETLDYLDNLCNRERFTDQGDALTFESEVDRVYLSSSDVIAVFDYEKKRTFLIKKEGLPDVVVWNPWERNSKAIEDLGNGEYRHMVCIDGAAVEQPISLKAGEEWTGKLELFVRRST